MTTPEELDALQAELRIIGCHSNGDARCTCSIGADADAAITDLRARIAELEAENFSLASWQCEFTDGKTGLVCHDNGGTYCQMQRRAEAAEAELARRGQGVRVKPLAWKHYKPDDTYPEAWCADCIGGFYTVIKDGPRAFRWLNTEGREFDGETSEVGAKAAAQTDYDARIRAAIVSPGDGWRDVLSGLSSYLGAGLGDEGATLEQYDSRIRWGIEHQASAIVQRCADVIEELSKEAYSGKRIPWGQIKKAVLAVCPAPPASEGA